MGLPVTDLFKILADFGVVFLMFVAGLETDVALMRSTVAPAFLAATGGVILPMAGGYALSRMFDSAMPRLCSSARFSLRPVSPSQHRR